MSPPPLPVRTAASPHITSTLERSLRRARRVWWGVAVLRSFAIAAALAALVLPIAWIAALRSGEAGTVLAARVPELTVPLGATFVLALIAALAVAAGRAPSLLDLARRADRVLDQAQRLSTSFEVHARGGPSTLVAHALTEDAERRAAELDWRPVGRIGWGRVAPVLVAAAFVVALLGTVVPVPLRPLVVPSGTPDAAIAPDRVEPDAATIERFAELLEAVAEQEDDAYLRAVATSFADLAERLGAGTIGAVEADRVLEELVGHLQVAARDVGGAFADAIQAALAPESGIAGGAGGGADRDASTAGGARDAEGADGAAAEDGVPPVAFDPEAATADASLYSALEDLANEFGDDPAGLGLRPPRPAFIDVDAEDAFYGGVGRAETDPNARPAESSGLRADAPGAGDVAGAAEQSSDRAGDAAGGGAAALGGGADSFLSLESETTTVAALPWNERADGRFTEVELVPDAVLGEARAFDRGTPAGPFRRTDEAASTARSVGAAYRDVVSRYFMPGAVQAGGTP